VYSHSEAQKPRLGRYFCRSLLQRRTTPFMIRMIQEPVSSQTRQEKRTPPEILLYSSTHNTHSSTYTLEFRILEVTSISPTNNKVLPRPPAAGDCREFASSFFGSGIMGSGAVGRRHHGPRSGEANLLGTYILGGEAVQCEGKSLLDYVDSYYVDS
jgi:hypothetical protein